jgi:hypothetical protein
MGNKEKMIERLGEEGYRKFMAENARKKWAKYDPDKKRHKSGLSYKTAEERKEIARMGGLAKARNAKQKSTESK